MATQPPRREKRRRRRKPAGGSSTQNGRHQGGGGQRPALQERAKRSEDARLVDSKQSYARRVQMSKKYAIRVQVFWLGRPARNTQTKRKSLCKDENKS